MEYSLLGIESGCNSQLIRYNKGISATNNIKAIEIVRKSGINIDLGFIPFDPWTTLDELAENLNFIRYANLIHQPVRLMKKILITPGSPIAKKYIKEYPETSILLNELTLDYKILDERVAFITDLVTQRWATKSSTIYQIQTKRRITPYSEGNTKWDTANESLCKDRVNDYKFVNACVQAAQNQPENWEKAIMEIVNTFAD